MTIKAFLYVYVLGGLTFIPLLLAAILIPAWLLLPRVENHGGILKKQVEERQNKDDKSEKETQDVSPAEGAEGAFAVLRRYDFASAHAALSARITTGNAVAGVSTGVDGAVGDAGGVSESVYQSMYRSVFDRGKGGGATSSSTTLESEDAGAAGTNGRVRRKAVVPANVFHVVLRHGHLMLYDSSAQIEVRHVISLAHHSISLSVSGTDDTENLREGDLFIKRTAIALKPIELPNGHLQQHAAPSKPFFLFSLNYSEKEDFYHALLTTRASPPIPEFLPSNDMIKLQSTLHSTSLTPETRALNALVSRMFLALYHTDRAKNFIQNKIERKISRVQKPAFIASVNLQSIDLGDAAPVLSNPRLKELNIEGDMTVAIDVRYTGGLKLTISALAKLDLGPRFKTRTADLVLASSLQRLQGHILVRIKPPPSNRIWFCFDGAPEMDIKIEPVVSQRQITYAFVLRAIEERIRAVVAETLVKPNWDDIPFYSTVGQQVRGGIWKDGGDGGSSAGEVLSERNEKTKSMPALPTDAESASVTSSGAETPPKAASISSSAYVNHAALADIKRRSVSSLPTRTATSASSDRPLAQAPTPTRPLRSPSFTSPSASAPSLKLDEASANVDPVRGDETAQQASKRWRIRSAAQQLPSKRDAVDAMRALSTPKAEDSHADTVVDEIADHNEEARPPVSRSFSTRSLRSPKRTDTNMSTSTTESAATTRSAQQRKQNLLAAAGTATIAAKNWGWNALANAKKNPPILRSGATASGTGASAGASSVTQQEPMGRGQPLPPPGVPLPGPNKGLFGSLTGSAKKKPVLPARRPTLDQQEAGKSGANVYVAETADSIDRDAQMSLSDEFGPWRENSGAGLEVDVEDFGQRGADSASLSGVSGDEVVVPAAVSNGNEEATPIAEKTVPPPLPARRPTVPIEPEYVSEGESIEVLERSASPNELTDEEEIIAIPAPIEEDESEHMQSDDKGLDLRTVNDQSQLESEVGEQDAQVHANTAATGELHSEASAEQTAARFD